MKESVIYQEIQAEAEAKGKAEGKQEEAANLVLRLLQRRLGAIPTTLVAAIRNLSVEQLESLGESLLDFQSLEDLNRWFA